jgi:hypothetical protein
MPKTTENDNDVSAFIATNPLKREDAERIDKLFSKATGLTAKMWGTAIIGYGSYHYKYESGHRGDAPLTGFSPRKDSFALYLSADFPKRQELLAKLGRHKTGKACIYIKKLDDVDADVLSEMIACSADYIRKKYHP